MKKYSFQVLYVDHDGNNKAIVIDQMSHSIEQAEKVIAENFRELQDVNSPIQLLTIID